MQRVDTEHRAVDFDRRQAAQIFDHVVFGYFHRFVQGFSFDHIGQIAGYGDRRRATQSFELNILDDIIFDLQIYFHHVAADRIAFLPDRVAILHLALIMRILEML